MKRFYFFCIPTVFLLILTSCKKDNNSTSVELGYDYVVKDIGHYIIYQVDSVVYNDFDNSVRDTTLLFKEIITELFKDNLGRDAYRVERYEKGDAEQDWSLSRTYYFVPEKSRLERIEENLRFISFVFPPDKGVEWDGNKFIEAVDNLKYLKGWTYEFVTVDEPLILNGKNYSKTAEILLEDKETMIEKTFAKEIFARNVGVIYKEWWHLETQKINDNPWLEKAEKGYIVKMQAVDCGME